MLLATANDSCHMSRDIAWLSGARDFHMLVVRYGKPSCFVLTCGYRCVDPPDASQRTLAKYPLRRGRESCKSDQSRTVSA